MEFNKKVSNPLLVGTIEVMKAEDTPEHRSLFVSELVKAQLLTPVVADPAPELDESGQLKLIKGSRVQFPMLTTPDGKRFYMAFTDMMELKRWKNEENPAFFNITFQDCAGMLFGKDAKGNSSPALGFVINPFGANIVVPREMVMQIMAPRKQ